MERTKPKKKIVVVQPGVPLTQEVAPDQLSAATGGRFADRMLQRNVGCGGPNDCIA